MNKKLFLTGLLAVIFLIVLSTTAAAIDDTDLIRCWSGDDTLVDLTNNNNLTIVGSPSYQTGHIGNSYQASTNNYYSGTSALSGLTSWTLDWWGYRNTDTGSWERWLGEDGTDWNLYMDINVGDKLFWATQDSNGVHGNYEISGTVAPATWVHYTLVRGPGGDTMFVNGVNDSNNFYSGSAMTTSENFFLGNDVSGSTALKRFDEFKIFDVALTPADVTALEDGGTGLSCSDLITPPTPPSTNSTESLETTAVIKQVGTTSINSAILKTILSSNFEVTEPTVALYGSYTFNVESSANNDLYCQMDVDGIIRANATRSNEVGKIGAMAMITPMFNLTSGNYTQTLQCRKIGAGGATISNAVGVGHFMIDSLNRTINYASNSFSVSTTSASYAKVGTFNFTVNNLTDDDLQNSIVLEWNAEYKNNWIVGEFLDTYISINGSNCSFYPRSVSIGNTGSVGGDCILENVTTNGTYVIDLYAKGSAAIFTGNIIAKQLFSDPEEIIGGTGVITGLTFSGETAQKLFNVSGGNINHVLANAFSKLSYSLSANQTTDATFYFKLVNGSTYQSVNFTRTVDLNTGVLVGQDVFENLPQDTYQTELWGSCPDSTCTIEGGSSLGYITDIILSISNSFNVLGKDVYDGATINDFNVTNGVVTSAVNGNATIVSDTFFVNLTISASGYYNTTIINHNTSQDITVNLTQSYANIQAYDKITFFQLTNFSVNNSFVSASTTNGTIRIPVNQGNKTFTFTNTQGYYNYSFDLEVLSLTDEYYNVSNVHNHKLTFTANNTLTGLAVNNFTINLSNAGNVYMENFSTTTGSITFNISAGIVYNSTIDALGFAILSSNHSAIGLTSSYVYNLLTTNSIAITFYDINTLSILNTTNVTAEFIGTSAQTLITSNGTLYVDLLQPSAYTIVYTADGYRRNQYILTVTNRSTNTLDLYLDTINDSTLILMTVSDTFGNLLPNAPITIQRYVNDGWITEQIVETDFQGRTEAFFTLSTEFYNFIIEFQGITYFGAPNSDENKKVIYAEDVNTGLNFFINILGQESSVGTVGRVFGVDVNLSFIDTSDGNKTSGYFRYYYDDPDNNQHLACLEVVKGYSSEVVCSCDSNTVTSESSTITCVVNQTDGRENYRAVGFLDTIPAISANIVLGLDEQLDWGLTGYFIATILVIVGFFIFIKVPSISIFVGSGILIILSVFGVAFKDVSFGAWIILLVIAYLVASIRSNSGVNG